MSTVIKPSKAYILPRSPGNYASIILECINDKKLVGGLLETLVYIRSKPPGWRVRAAEVANRFDLNIGTAQKRISKLIEIGYIKREQLKNLDGSFGDFEIYVADKPVFKDGGTAFIPEYVDKAIESIPIPRPSIDDKPTNLVNQEPLMAFPLAAEPLAVKPLLSNTYDSNTELTKHLSKQAASNIGSIKRMREVLANQIAVSKQTVPSRLTAYAAAGIFKKKSGRERLDKMNAQMQAEILARRTPCQTT